MLLKNIRDKIKLLENADDVFFTAIQRIERRILSGVIDFLSTFSSRRGTILNDSDNEEIILGLDDELNRIFAESPLQSEVDKFLAEFDKIEDLNRLIYDGTLTRAEARRAARLTFSRERIFIADDISLALTNPQVLTVNVIKPIRDLLFESITFERSIKETEELLRNEIVTRQGSNSRLLRYTKQISRDAITQFDGAINDRIRDELQLDGFMYVGSIVKNSRDNCVHLVNGTGKFADLALRPGLYKVSDIPEIIERGRGGKGFNDAVTAATFGRYRFGYNCRHSLVYLRLLDDDFRNKELQEIADDI